jgi:hypothetical protein
LLTGEAVGERDFGAHDDDLGLLLFAQGHDLRHGGRGRLLDDASADAPRCAAIAGRDNDARAARGAGPRDGVLAAAGADHKDGGS